jgi:hypothetical protein
MRTLWCARLSLHRIGSSHRRMASGRLRSRTIIIKCGRCHQRRLTIGMRSLRRIGIWSRRIETLNLRTATSGSRSREGRVRKKRIRWYGPRLQCRSATRNRNGSKSRSSINGTRPGQLLLLQPRGSRHGRRRRDRRSRTSPKAIEADWLCCDVIGSQDVGVRTR